MADPHSSLLDTKIEGGWLTLTLNDPARKNALSGEMAAALLAAAESAAEDAAIRGVTLRGHGGVFCSGGDLKGMAGKIMAGDRGAIVAMSADAGRLFEAFYRLPKPVLALVEGPALAGGLGLVCCADMVAVTRDAQFALTEVRLGIPPAQIAPFVVARLGLNQAKRLMLTGARFGGEEAVRFGLADHLADVPDGLAAYEADVRKAVCAGAPGAIAATKRLAQSAAENPPSALRDEAAAAFADCLLSDEGAEGIRSFVEKRKPRWAPHD